jgi:hypothetical protein
MLYRQKLVLKECSIFLCVRFGLTIKEWWLRRVSRVTSRYVVKALMPNDGSTDYFYANQVSPCNKIAEDCPMIEGRCDGSGVDGRAEA